jgi:phasin family protein
MAKKPEATDFSEMFAHFGRDLKMPKVDVEAILAHHRKNLEALQQSISASSGGMTNAFHKQRDAFQEMLREATDLAQSYRAPGAPQEVMAKQAEFARKTFEAAVRNAGEMAEIARKSGTESVDILRKRIREAMEEIRDNFDKRV